jgi:hypothetical protein
MAVCFFCGDFSYVKASTDDLAPNPKIIPGTFPHPFDNLTINSLNLLTFLLMTDFLPCHYNEFIDLLFRIMKTNHSGVRGERSHVIWNSRVSRKNS